MRLAGLSELGSRFRFIKMDICDRQALFALLKAEKFGYGFAWLDTGTHDSLYQATNFVQVLEARQGIKIACLEAIAFSKGWITAERLKEVAAPMAKNPYGQYLLDLADGKIQLEV